MEINNDTLIAIGEHVAEQALQLFKDCGAEGDFCLQDIGMDNIVFGGTNRLILDCHNGFHPDSTLCTSNFLEKWGQR